MKFNLETFEIDPDAARQYLDARTAFIELERTKKNALQVRGGMVWKAVGGKDYLIRTSTTGGQKSLGRRSADTEAMYSNFVEKKQNVAERLESLKAVVAKHVRMNRALRVGRTPNLTVAILNRIADAGLAGYFRVVGTHALYAYEAAAGIRFASEVTSTRDIDLLWDARRRVTFAQMLVKDSPSMLSILQKVDKTFELNPDQKYTAINKSGFEVDILRRVAKEGDPHPIRLSDSEDDFWVVQAGDPLQNSCKSETAGSGWDARRLFEANSQPIGKKSNAADRLSPAARGPHGVLQRDPNGPIIRWPASDATALLPRYAYQARTPLSPQCQCARHPFALQFRNARRPYALCGAALLGRVFK